MKNSVLKNQYLIFHLSFIIKNIILRQIKNK